MPLGGSMLSIRDGFRYPGNWDTREEIRKIWSPSNEHYMFLDTQNYGFSLKIVGNSRAGAVLWRHLRNLLAGGSRLEHHGRPEAARWNTKALPANPGEDVVQI